MAFALGSLLLVTAGEVRAQSSSMYLGALEKSRVAAENAKGKLPSGAGEGQNVGRVRPLNPELEQTSLLAVKTKSPNEFKVHDLITVIVREEKNYESDSLLRNKREFKIETKLDEFFRILNGNLAAASFTGGKPNISFDMETELKSRGDAEREDKLTFRLTVEIIDIKPNGLLVLASGPEHKILIDRELQDISFTGMCRSRDVTPDNSILSTQVFNQVINIQHKGVVRAAAKRGWLMRLFDWMNPI
jgi:flagellar L-ring protein precursor FlgH